MNGNSSTHQGVKICVVALMLLAFIFPLLMIEGVIDDRERTKHEVQREVAASYAESQIVRGPTLLSKITVPSSTNPNEYNDKHQAFAPKVLNYKADVKTDILHRSIYNVIVYTSEIGINGNFTVTQDAVNALQNYLQLYVTDFKGLAEHPYVNIGTKKYTFESDGEYLMAQIELPEGSKVGDEINFSISLKLRGTESLEFKPIGEQTSLTINSSYPHPSFMGEYLPETRDVRNDGFNATWRVLNINSGYGHMGVKFIEPANPYQQSMRSVKYGMLIIFLVFIAGFCVEFITRKKINLIQYGVIGLSLALFYALLLSFSEFMAFGISYLLAAAMTTTALMLYFRAILKNRSAYVLGGFIAGVYLVNYMLLQMDTYALLAGSLILFVMLSVVMYLTANTKPSPEE